MLSRPNIVMNHGRPAAGRLFPPAMTGANRSAARSTRLRRYVATSESQSQARRGASAIQRSSSSSTASRGRLAAAALGRRGRLPGPNMAGTTCSSVVQEPCGSTRAVNCSPRSSTWAGSVVETVVVEDGELLPEATVDGALADHRELCVNVDGAGAGHEEEPGLEVLQVVG